VTNCDYLVIVAKGKSQGGRVCKKGTRNDACGGETTDLDLKLLFLMII